MYNIFYNNFNFWNSRLILIDISDFWERITFTCFYFELLCTQPKPFPSARLFYQVHVDIVGQCLISKDLSYLEHSCKFVQNLYESGGEEYFVIQYSHSAVLYDVDYNRNCYHWPLHLVTSFHISIVPSILFHLRKIFNITRYSSRLHFCLVLLASVTLFVFMTKGPLLDDGLVWAASCSLFTGDFDPVTNFLIPVWSDSEGLTPCLSTRRVMWHDFFHVDLLIMLIAVSFKCHKRQYF